MSEANAVKRVLESLPQVRVSQLQPDGQVTGYEEFSVDHFAGTIPAVGDIIGMIFGENDHDLQVVERRYFIRELQRDWYWLLLVKDAEKETQFDAVTNNALLGTDLVSAIRSSRPREEIVERVAQLSGRKPKGRRYRPKIRKLD